MKRILLDMSSILWSCLLVGEDKENGRKEPWPDDAEKKPMQINSAEYGFEAFVNSLVATLNRFEAAPRDVVMVFDGRDAKQFRKQLYPDYKAGRDHHPACYEQFNRLKDMARQTLLDLGALACEQQQREADDVIAYLAKNLKTKNIIVSNDGDLLALHSPNTDVYRNGELNENKYGPFPHQYITLYKALVGDSTDNIKGAKGFGPKAFVDLLVAFGYDGLELMTELIINRELDRLAEDVGELKSLQKIIDDKEAVYVSYDCARMYPDKVNMFKQPMQIQAGLVKPWDRTKHDQRLKQWYGARRVVHAGNYADACAWAMGKILESDIVATDIETSVPPESDEWLAARKRSKGIEDTDNLGVDVLASKLTGQSFAFGKNAQYSLYFTVDHCETDGVANVKSEDVRKFIELIPDSKPLVVQNAAFELTVLYQEWGKAWANNGWHGFLPNVDDTALMKSYVDENTSRHLKEMSETILGYKQQTYAEVTQGRKMNEMTAEETLGYGVDDSICTAALYNYLRFVMELEDTWDVYRQVEIRPAYLNALRFVRGTPISMERLLDLEREDKAAYEAAWAVLRDFLIKRGWEGTVCPKFEALSDLTPSRIKEAYQIVTGKELKTQVRTPTKLCVLIREAECILLATLIGTALEGGSVQALNEYVKQRFRGEPQLDLDSPKQMQKFLYETLGLPIRLRNKATDNMRAKGISEGTPKTNDIAVEFALAYDQDKGPEVIQVLKAIQTMKDTSTRQKLFYTPYRFMRHWKDELVHAEVNQCATVTRRPTSSNPNLYQLPKHPKHGKAPKFREVYVPHGKNGVVVSIDFAGQELRNEADWSKDPNLLACFIGDSTKDVHALTATGIMLKKTPAQLWRMLGNEGEPSEEMVARWRAYDYEAFERARADEEHPDYKLCAKVLRPIGKTTNFLTEYGGQAPKLSERLICPVEEAQVYLEAKLASFPRAEEWKKEVIAEAHKLGYQTTMLGARRHLPELKSSNGYNIGKAERQAVNYKIQGSCAEQTKLAEGRLWDGGIFFRYDARYIGAIYDEIVTSVCGSPDEIVAFIREVHAAMTAPYANMTVPIIGSISLGPNFGTQIECGDEFDEKRIREALQSLGIGAIMTAA